MESHTDSVKELVPLPHQPGVIASVGDNSIKVCYFIFVFISHFCNGFEIYDVIEGRALLMC